MNRSILGVIAVATIAAAAPASAAVKALPPAPPFTGGGAYAGANWANGQFADLGRLDAVHSYVAVVGGGVPGYNFQYRQLACIRVGHRLQC